MKKAVILVVCALAACSRNMNAGGDFSSAYHRLAKSMTREKKLFGMERVLYNTSILYRSCDLRRAYVEEYAKAYKLDADKTQAMMDREIEECGKYEEFVVAHFASETATRRLDTTPGVWKISLVANQDEAHSIDPESVVTLPGDPPVIRYFYPFMTPWSKAYRVRFPKQGAGSLSLRMDGVEDNLAFAWNPSR